MPQHIITDHWVRGWSNILKFTGYRSKSTIVRYVRDYSFPLRHLPSGEVTIIVSEVNEWLKSFTELAAPYRLQRLTGAAQASAQGLPQGAVARSMEAFKERMRRLHIEADLSGRPKGVPPYNGPIPH